MSPARRVARAGRNLFIALLVGAVLIVAIVVAFVAGRSTSTPSAAPTSETPTHLSRGAPTTGSSDAAPTGCLGGPGRDVSMLLNAQAAAPHSSFGAVEVAAAFLRWAYRYPYPTDAQADQVASRLVSSRASSSFRDIAASFRSAKDITGGQVARGTSFYLSTATGSWVVQGGQSASRVTVDLTAAYVVDGQLSSTKSAAVSATVVWESGGWRLLSEQAPDTGLLSAGGTQFTAGC